MDVFPSVPRPSSIAVASDTEAFFSSSLNSESKDAVPSTWSDVVVKCLTRSSPNKVKRFDPDRELIPESMVANCKEAWEDDWTCCGCCLITDTGNAPEAGDALSTLSPSCVEEKEVKPIPREEKRPRPRVNNPLPPELLRKSPCTPNEQAPITG